MLTGSIYGWENGGDDIFNPHSTRNRDNCLEPMRVLQQEAEKNHIALHTADVNERNCIAADFSLYVESIDFVPSLAKRNYLILYETHLTVPRNADYHYLNQFDFIFSWDRNLLEHGFEDGKGNLISSARFVEIYHPNPIPVECTADFQSPSFDQRQDFACLIGSNRHANLIDERELYSERVKAIRWFEANALSDFHLYGNGWKVPQKRLGRLGRLRYRLEKLFPWLTGQPVFPSYLGPAKTKYEVLNRTKFCICYENARDIPGYITEKIFDCLFAGCIPIYWGDAAISRFVPESCYIDFQKFQSYQDLYQHLTLMSPERFAQYQEAAQHFLKSELFLPFRSESFAFAIVNKILSDFRGEM
jgi:hypothetical protein